jgi:predicted PurR-regulated permease PerM
VFLLRYAQEFFIPIVLSVLIAYALDPLVNLLARLRIHRALASAIVLMGLSGMAATGMYSMRSQAEAVIESVPEAARKVREMVRTRNAAPGSAGPIDKIREAATELEKAAAEAAGQKAAGRNAPRMQLAEPVFSANQYLLSGSLGVARLAGQAAMIFFLVYFLLAAGDLYKRKLVKIAGNTLAEKRVTVEILNQINMQIERFLVVQIATSALVAVATGLALWAMGVNQPAVWGLAAGIFNSIPYFGAIIVTGGLALVGLLQFGSISMTLYVAGVAFLITSLEGFLLTPALMGKAARMNQVAIFISLLFWSWIWGVIGMILAVPIMMVIKSVSDRFESLTPVRELLSEK